MHNYLCIYALVSFYTVIQYNTIIIMHCNCKHRVHFCNCTHHIQYLCCAYTNFVRFCILTIINKINLYSKDNIMVVLCLFLFPSMYTYHISVSAGDSFVSKGSNFFWLNCNHCTHFLTPFLILQLLFWKLLPKPLLCTNLSAYSYQWLCWILHLINYVAKVQVKFTLLVCSNNAPTVAQVY